MFDKNSDFVQEIITEISMSSDNKPWLILEGSSDAHFFRSRKIITNPKLIVAIGWENVVKIVSTTKDENISNFVFGVIDRDYREALNLKIEYDNIVNTDYRDLEVMLFYSEAFERVFSELGSVDKLPCLQNSVIDFKKIKASIIDISREIGKFRFYCQKNTLHISFKEIDYSKFIDYQFLTLDPQKLINHLNGKNIGVENITVKMWNQSQECALPKLLEDNKFISHGHDIMNIVGISLRKKWGSIASKDACNEKIEKFFRVGYSDTEFQKTNLFLNLTGHLTLTQTRRTQ